MISVVLMLVLIGWLIMDHRKVMKELRAIRDEHTVENDSHHGIMVTGGN